MIVPLFPKAMDFHIKPQTHTLGKLWELVLEGGAGTEGALI